ncbi:MAG TPA: tetratricopeptide repeat protein [Vicinamibacteria bacterium]|nr:tetratricopeptide repeat protein [Vicinamibacteria bacterium]
MGLASLAPPGTSGADTIVLTNGRVIEADRAWFEGAQLRYEKGGGVFGLPRALVARLENTGSPGGPDPDVARARERMAANDPAEAVKLLQVALGRDPGSLPALYALAEAQLGLGDARAARETAARVVRLDARNARAHALLADAYAAMGDRVAAELEYRESLRLHADPDVQRRLEEVAAAPARLDGAAQFLLRYDGGDSHPLGPAVLQILGAAYTEYARRFGFRPQGAIAVVLQTEAAFQDARTPEWAAGVNDGSIRMPVGGLEGTTLGRRQVAVLRHELAHSFIAARTGGNCPTWLQEGISQWLEGGDPAREDALLADAARLGTIHPLLTLEAPFQTLPAGDVPRAYAESLSAVAHIIRRRTEKGVVRLLNALGDGHPSEEALPIALALSYPEFQKSWEDYLRSLGARRP